MARPEHARAMLHTKSLGDGVPSAVASADHEVTAQVQLRRPPPVRRYHRPDLLRLLRLRQCIQRTPARAHPA